MSAEAIAETTRYEGLIRTAQELFDAHEESGWRLANVIYDAMMELKLNRGLPLQTAHRDPGGASAAHELSRDLDRRGMSPTNAYRYFRTWKRYGAKAKRLDGLTFGDHWELMRNTREKAPYYPDAVAALQRMRADRQAGRKPEFSGATATVAAVRRGPSAGRRTDNMVALNGVKGRLRIVLKSNVWDYPDHQKVLDHLVETRDLLDRVEAKPWSTGAGESRPAEDALFDQIKRVLDAHPRRLMSHGSPQCQCGAELDCALAPDDAHRAHVAAELAAAKPWSAGGAR